ncbi:MAG: hypothetical protein LBR07_02040, partial [Puniceicoccales bacterium]|nr:hypothetical protein [Puniceicoccales bacterium]
SDATAAAYVCIERDSDHARFWGCGLDSSIETAAVNALVSALNRSITGA